MSIFYPLKKWKFDNVPGPMHHFLRHLNTHIYFKKFNFLIVLNVSKENKYEYEENNENPNEKAEDRKIRIA